MMWKNIGIRWKLLWGFGLLLAVFAAAILYSWIKIDRVGEESLFLAQGNVPSMLLGSNVERHACELFYAMRGFRYKEDESNLKTVREFAGKVKADLDTAKSRYAEDPRLIGLKPLVESVNPAYEAYMRNVEAVVPVTREKQAAWAKLVENNIEMGDLADRMAEAMYRALNEEAAGLNAEQFLRKTEMIRQCEDLKDLVSGMRIAILRSLLVEDIAGIQETRKTAAGIAERAAGLHDGMGRQDLKDMMGDLRKKAEGCGAILDAFVKLYVEVQTLTDQRRPLMEQVSASSTEGSVLAQNHVKSVAEAGVADLDMSVRILTISAAVAIVLGLAVALLIARGIAGPLGTIVKLAARAGDGDLTVEREEFGCSRRDELGKLADALANMIEAQKHTIVQAVSVAEKVAEGAENLSAISGQTNAAMEEVKASIDQVSGLSESNGAALQECNAGVEEMSSGADMVARSATDSAAFIARTAEISNSAIGMVNGVIRGMQSVHENARRNEEKMNQLVAAVEKIGGFVSVITGIADQTNLLALNAAIEAARAGDAGKGFAVVAEEVRKLAEESARSAKNVGEIIGRLQQSAGESIDVTVEAGRLLTETLSQADRAQAELNTVLSEMNNASDSIRNIATVAEEQAASSKEVASAIDSATRATMQVVENIANIHHSSDETAQAAQSVAEQSQAMTGYSQKLKEVLSRFKIPHQDAAPASRYQKALIPNRK